jgi:hypothetical protein
MKRWLYCSSLLACLLTCSLGCGPSTQSSAVAQPAAATSGSPSTSTNSQPTAATNLIPPVPPNSRTSVPPVDVVQAQLDDGTPVQIITSKKSETATPEERRAAVARVFAPTAGAATESGVSAESIKAEMVRDFLKRYPKMPPEVLAPVANEYHRQVVILSRRSDGSVSADYYRKEMAWRLEAFIGNVPQYQ